MGNLINPHRFGGGSVLVYDSFTDTDGTLIASHTPEIDGVGGGWTLVNGSFDINSNRLKSTSNAPAGVAKNLCVIDAGVSDCIITARSFDSNFNAGNNTGICLRYQDSNNFIMATFAGENYALVKIEGGASSTIISEDMGLLVGTGYWYENDPIDMQVTLSGNSISVLVTAENGTTYENTSSSSFLADKTKHGFRIYEGEPGFDTTVESFRVHTEGADFSYWEYTSLSAAESSGDGWSDGDTIKILGGATFLYKSALAVDGYSGLVHKNPFDDADATDSTTVLNSESEGTDPDSWTGWTDAGIGTKGVDYDFDTTSGRARLNDKTSSGRAVIRRESEQTSSHTTTFAILDRLTGVSGISVGDTTQDCQFYLTSYDDGVNSNLIKILRYRDGVSTNWRTFAGASITESSKTSTTERRLFMYVGETKYAFWFDGDSAPIDSGTHSNIIATTITCSFIAGHTSYSGSNMQLGRHLIGYMATS